MVTLYYVNVSYNSKANILFLNQNKNRVFFVLINLDTNLFLRVPYYLT